MKSTPGGGRATSLARRRRFWAMAASVNSNWASRVRAIAVDRAGGCASQALKAVMRLQHDMYHD